MSRARDTADQINRVNSSAADANAITVDGTKVGIGTTPSATYSAFDTIEFNTASIISQNTATGGASPDGNLVLGSNMNYSSGGGPEYKVTGKATQITQVDGNITLGVATSGTANTNITYNTGLEVLNDGYARAKNGLLFGTDTAAANALDDYEEGTWTPSWGSSGTNPTVSYSAQIGKYTKVGNTVFAWGIISGNPTGAGTGSIFLNGLPFNPNATGEIAGGQIGFCNHFDSGYTPLAIHADNNNTYCWLYYSTSHGGYTTDATPANTLRLGSLYFSVNYSVY